MTEETACCAFCGKKSPVVGKAEGMYPLRITFVDNGPLAGWIVVHDPEQGTRYFCNQRHENKWRFRHAS